MQRICAAPEPARNIAIRAWQACSNPHPKARVTTLRLRDSCERSRERRADPDCASPWREQMADITRRQFLGSTGIGVAGLGYMARLPAAAAEAETPEPKRGGVLTIGQDDNPIGLDPHKTA